MDSREVVTLTFGEQSNHAGASFWNFQDETFVPAHEEEQGALDSTVLYRQGETPTGYATVTPRALIFDELGSLGSLPEQGVLYYHDQPVEPTPAAASETWAAQVEVFQQPRYPKNAFLRSLDDEPEGYVDEDNPDVRPTDPDDLPPPPPASQAQEGEGEPESKEGQPEEQTQPEEQPQEQNPLRPDPFQIADQVKLWTDYFKVHVHHRTIHQLSQHRRGAKQRFDVFSQGAWANQPEDDVEAARDDLRRFLEECNSVQGFQVAADLDSGFGGFAADMLTEIADSCAGVPVLALGVVGARAPASADDAAQRGINLGLGMHALAEGAAVAVPLFAHTWDRAAPRFAELLFDAERPFHAGALMAAGWDTATLPLRLLERAGGPARMRDLAAALAPRPTLNVALLDLALPFAEPAAGLPSLRALHARPAYSLPLSLGVPAAADEDPPPRPPYGHATVLRGARAPLRAAQDRWAEFLTVSRAGTGLHVASTVALPLPVCFPPLFRAHQDEHPPGLGAASALTAGAGARLLLDEVARNTRSSWRRARVRHRYEMTGVGEDELGEALAGVLAVRDAYDR